MLGYLVSAHLQLVPYALFIVVCAARLCITPEFPTYWCRMQYKIICDKTMSRTIITSATLMSLCQLVQQRQEFLVLGSWRNYGGHCNYARPAWTSFCNSKCCLTTQQWFIVCIIPYLCETFQYFFSNRIIEYALKLITIHNKSFCAVNNSIRRFAISVASGLVRLPPQHWEDNC